MDDRQSLDFLFRQLIPRYQGLLYTIGFAILLDREEVLDLLQEVFIKVLSQPDFHNEGFNQRGWLIRVTRNLALNRKRSLYRFFRMAQRFIFFESRLAEGRDPFSRSENFLDLERAMAPLEVEVRDILSLRYGGELTYEEIAVELGIPLGTVMSRIFRAKKKLKGEFEFREAENGTETD